MTAGSSFSASREAFGQAAAWFVATAARGRDSWDRTALGEWTARDLVGHTSRALLTVETYLGRPVSTVEVTSAVEYFRLALASNGDPASVARRGREAGAALGADPAAGVAVIAERVLITLGAAEENVVVGTPVGGMRLADYLPTRTFELTVHTYDLAAALQLDTRAPEAAAVESISLVGRLAARNGQAGSLLLAATGRGGLPAGFTVL